jgi:hypothetical protein
MNKPLCGARQRELRGKRGRGEPTPHMLGDDICPQMWLTTFRDKSFVLTQFAGRRSRDNNLGAAKDPLAVPRYR